MLRLRGFELYSRWVPLPSVSVALKIDLGVKITMHYNNPRLLELKHIRHINH